MDPIAILVGGVVGLSVGLTSCGGGSLLTPALVLFLSLAPSEAVGTSALIGALMKIVAGITYARRGSVHWPTVLRLAAGSVPGAAVGVLFLNQLPPALVEVVISKGLGLSMALVGVTLVIRLVQGEAPSDRPLPGARVTIAFGAAIGLLVSVTSVGSGSLVMCVFTQFFPLSAATLVGTDIVHAVLLSGTSAIGHAASGRVDPALAVAVLAGALPGTWLGARLATGLPDRPLRTGLALIVLASGVQLAFFQTPRASAAEPAAVLREHQR